VSRVAFGILHRELIQRLAAGRVVVVDATNLTKAARAAVLRRAALSRVPAVAVVLVAPAAVVHARNAGRPGRAVPADVVDRQLETAAELGEDAAAITARLRAEGFVGVSVVDAASTASLDGVAIVRRPR
jgi:protein phosphatase